MVLLAQPDKTIENGISNKSVNFFILPPDEKSFYSINIKDLFFCFSSSDCKN